MVTHFVFMELCAEERIQPLLKFSSVGHMARTASLLTRSASLSRTYGEITITARRDPDH